MTVIQEPTMGRFSIEVDLANNTDLILVEAGILSADKIRRVRLRGVVDSGATRLVLPESVATQLGLQMSSTATVRYANGQKAERSIAQGIHLSYGGRESVFNAVIEPDRDSALIGAIVLEDLDFLIDCGKQRLVPRDPDRIISEIE
jgi:predicted aspartyl protease